jgi:hypothetical protein
MFSGIRVSIRVCRCGWSEANSLPYQTFHQMFSGDCFG